MSDPKQPGLGEAAAASFDLTALPQAGAQRNGLDEFLNPKSMLTPGLAGGVVMLISGTLWKSFGMPTDITSLGLSFLLGILVFSTGNAILIHKCIYYFINSLIIFCVATGAGVTGAGITQASNVAHLGGLLPNEAKAGELFALPPGDGPFVVTDDTNPQFYQWTPDGKALERVQADPTNPNNRFFEPLNTGPTLVVPEPGSGRIDQYELPAAYLLNPSYIERPDFQSDDLITPVMPGEDALSNEIIAPGSGPLSEPRERNFFGGWVRQ